MIQRAETTIQRARSAFNSSTPRQLPVGRKIGKPCVCCRKIALALTTPVARVYECWATHAAGVKVWEALDREIGKPRENRGQIIADWKFQPAAAFYDRKKRMAATFGPACGLPMWIQFFRPRATGRIEFSARLLLSSSSGYSRNRVSFLHSVSADGRSVCRRRGSSPQSNWSHGGILCARQEPRLFWMRFRRRGSTVRRFAFQRTEQSLSIRAHTVEEAYPIWNIRNLSQQ